MKVKIIDKDRFNVVIKNIENGQMVAVQRYPMSAHAAWHQIRVYQDYIKYNWIGDVVEIPDEEIKYSLKYLKRRTK